MSDEPQRSPEAPVASGAAPGAPGPPTGPEPGPGSFLTGHPLGRLAGVLLRPVATFRSLRRDSRPPGLSILGGISTAAAAAIVGGLWVLWIGLTTAMAGLSGTLGAPPGG